MISTDEKSAVSCDAAEVKKTAAERIRRLECEAAMASLLGALLRTEPNEEWLGKLASDNTFEVIPYAENDENAMQGQRLLDGWTQAWIDGEREAGQDALYADYLALFVGPGAPLAPPWGSVYAHEGEALLFQRETLDVRARFREFGFQVERLYHEPDDHVGYELEFVAALALREADALARNDFGEADRAACAKAGFLADHLACWGERWADLVARHAATGFYRGVALLFKGFLHAAS